MDVLIKETLFKPIETCVLVKKMKGSGIGLEQ